MSELSPTIRARLQRRLLTWFRTHRRDLPWRSRRDPYSIWVAEIMLQQTRVAAVLPYYDRFLKNFPTIESLAASRQEQILNSWSGLGYYSRARNLHRAAQEIIALHGGKFPVTLQAALALPGVGRYTAAAVLSIAYDVPLAALDGNIARVLARLGAVRGDLRARLRWRRLEKTADHLLVQHAPGDWNQALMELGEIVCTPQAPSCRNCPLSRFCRAHALGLTRDIPAPRRKRLTVSVRIAAAVFRDPRGRTILVRDPAAHLGKLFSRLWQFPAIEVIREPHSELERYLRQILHLGSEPLKLQALPAARHSVTFREITLLPFLACVAELPQRPGTRIVPFDRLVRLPISSATRKIAAAATPKLARSTLSLPLRSAALGGNG
jgi:A/G-specific adenine glycosylase